MRTDLRYAHIALLTADNTAAARTHVAAHPAEVDAVLACFGMIDELTASQIHTFSGVSTYTVECMVETGHLTHTGYRAGYPIYTL